MNLTIFLTNNITTLKGGRKELTWEGREKGGMAQTMYTHLSKCKNNKIKREKKKKKRINLSNFCTQFVDHYPQIKEKRAVNK
jgi:hypothetical protein